MKLDFLHAHTAIHADMPLNQRTGQHNWPWDLKFSGDEDVDDDLMGCNTVWTCRFLSVYKSTLCYIPEDQHKHDWPCSGWQLNITTILIH
jgi:hypothetical protein